MTRFEKILSEALSNMDNGTKCPQCNTSIIVQPGEPTKCSICGYTDQISPAQKPRFIGDRFSDNARLAPPRSLPGMNVGVGAANDRAGANGG
jgi:ribosomal protein S27AE